MHCYLQSNIFPTLSLTILIWEDLLLRVLFFLTLFIFSLCSVAEDVKTNNIFVTATRSMENSKNLVSDVSIINKDEIESSGSSSLVDLLQRQPGIEISNTGGIGKQSSIYLRGSNANQLIVLIDGVRLNSISTGLMAFENIPLSQIERIEILRGPSASIYGSDAIGGVIQLFTKKNKSGFSSYANFGLSRYNTKSSTIGLSSGHEKIQYGLYVTSINSEGFSSLDSNEPIIKDNDGFNSLNINGNINYDFDTNNSIKLSFLNNSGHNEYDNRYRSYYGNTVPNVKNKMLNQNINLKLLNKFTSNWESNLLISTSLDKYTDQQVVNSSYDGLLRDDVYYQTVQNEFNWTNNFLSDFGKFNIAIDRLEQKLKSNNSYNINERNNTGYVLGYVNQIGKNIFQGSYRVDLNTHSGTTNTKNIGYGYYFSEDLKITAQYGEAFRNPTFNDLYASYDAYFIPNENLKSETSKNKEINLEYEKESHKYKLTIFNNKVEDLITLYTCGGYTCINNSNKANITGLTFNSDFFLDHTRFYSSFTTMSANNEELNKKLARRASLYGTIGITQYYNDWVFGGEMTGSGKKYNDAENNAPIPGYIISNLYINKPINKEWKFNLRLNNITNKEYFYAYEGNPTIGASNSYRYNNPGRSLFFNLIYETN